MLDIFGCCGSSPQPGSIAYEVFSKLPKVPLGGLKQFISSGGNLEQFLGNFGNIGGMGNQIGNISSFLPGQRGQGGFSSISKFVNNTPKESIKGTDGNLKQLIQNNKDGVIKKVLKSNYSKLVKEHQQKDSKWTDPDFPPEQASIGNVSDIPVRANWKRIPEVLKNAEFVSGKIQPGDIIQGSIGDCYFLSAISALAENDFRIKNLFPSLQISPYGIYMVRILSQGVIKQVVVDDYIPVTPQNTPLFAKPSGGRQIWVMILEKAWAKLHGSYAAIVGGLPNQVLHAFSGAPTQCRMISGDKGKQQKLWEDMLRSYQDGAVLCCGTKSDSNIEKAGLVLGHAYTILQVFENPARMLKIRNPWGKRQWKGRASENDTQFWSRLSPADKQKLGVQMKNDGIFFMLWEDFVNYFSLVDICKINDNANFNSVQANFNKRNGQMFEFETFQNGKVVLSLSQQSTRGKKQEIQKKGYSRATMIVSKKNSQKSAKGYQYSYVDSKSSRKFAQLFLQLTNLQKGKYVVFAKIDWIDKNEDQAGFSVYSEVQNTVIKSKQSNHDKFLYKTFVDHSRRNPKKQILSQSPEEWICSDFLMNQCGYGYLSFHLDEKSKKKIGVELSEKQFTDKRLVLKKPYKGQQKIKTMVEPGKELIIIYRLKSQNYPSNMTLPKPKIYNLV